MFGAFCLVANNGSLEYPSTDYYLGHQRFGDLNSTFGSFFHWQERYGFDAGDDETGEIIYTGALSLMSFNNHACDQDPSIVGLDKVYSWMEDEFWSVWNPVASRFRTEINHAAIFAKDVKKGDPINDDYTRWDHFHANRKEKRYGHEGVRVWCQTTSNSTTQ
jgi:hypothetical protein